MKNNQFGCQKIKSVCETKLEISFRGRKENNGWYFYEGRRAARITVPKGRHKVPKGTYRSMARQLFLSDPEFDELLECPMTRKKYDNILSNKIAF